MVLIPQGKVLQGSSLSTESLSQKQIHSPLSLTVFATGICAQVDRGIYSREKDDQSDHRWQNGGLTNC